MSWSVNNFFEKSQAVKQPHFMHDNLSFKLQRNADLPLHLPRWREITRNYTNTTQVHSYPGPFGQNAEIILRARLAGISKMADIVVE